MATPISAHPLLPHLALEQAQAAEEWAHRPLLGTAAELLASSILVAPNDAALEAAQFVLANPMLAGPLLVSRARAMLSSPDPKDNLGPERTTRASGASPDQAALQARLAPLKARVSLDPRDALAWLEMGRIHATTGNRLRADRAVRVALGLGGDSRLVLRSAARFFLHAGDAEFAHEILRRNARTRLDPWLSAAEIASAQVAERTPRTLRSGAELERAGRFNDHELSELRGALATIALTDGKRKDVRALLAASLHDPTENAVAQAVWVARQGQMIDVGKILQGALTTPGSFEARSVAAYNRGDWELAFQEGLQWIVDEPYSGRAALHTAVVAGVALDRHSEAIAIIRAGLRASPRNLSLQGNHVYHLAIGGRLEEASLAAREYRPPMGDTRHQVVGLANQGLIDFRAGRHAAGRLSYEAAIRLASEKQLRELQELATLYYLTEELLSGNRHIVPRAVEALARVDEQKSADQRLVAVRLRRELDRTLQL